MKVRKSTTLLGQRIPVDIKNSAIDHQIRQLKLGRKISLQQSYRELAKKLSRRS